MIRNLSLDQLAALLRETFNAHHEYERTHGADPDWPTWYASHMLTRSHLFTEPIDPSADRSTVESHISGALSPR